MKKFIPAIVFIVLALLCGVIYNIIGQTVLPDGTLQEPFFLIPFTFLFILLGILSFIIAAIMKCVQKCRKK